MKFYNFLNKTHLILNIIYCVIFKLEIKNLLKLIFTNRKFVLIDDDRIGHLSIDTVSLFEVFKNNEKLKRDYLIVFNLNNKNTSNIFLKKKLIEKLKENNFKVLITDLSFIIPKIFKKDNIEIKDIYKNLQKLEIEKFYLNQKLRFIPVFKNVYNEGKIFNKRYSSVLTFNNEELIKFESLKKKFNLENYVCTIARDKEYLKKNKKSQFNYHDYRNSDYQRLIKTIKYLIEEKKFKILRMGNIKSRLSSEIFNINHIDFYDKSKTGIEDILILSHCKFFIGDTAGIVTIPVIFNKPSIRYNWIPIFNSVSHNSLIIPALIKKKGTDKFISFRDLYKIYSKQNLKALRRSEFYKENNLEIVYNDENEIFSATQELLSKDIFNKKNDNQIQFEKMMKEFEIYNPGIVSPLFLEKNLNLFI